MRIHQPRPAILRCDNLSAVQLTANPVLHGRSKHFETDYHYVRERVALGVLEVQHVLSALELADIFTKSLPRQSFQTLRTKLSVGNLSTISLRGDESIQHQTAVGLSSPGEKAQQHKLISHNGDVLSKQQSIKTKRPAVADYEMSLSNQYVPLQAVECT